MAEPRPASIPSPCVSICALGEDDVCIGCHRSAAEISAWVLSDDAERRAVLARAAARAARNNPFAVRQPG
ncbi:MAG TPA: DUF1289 domain-containing protein [Porticoccaceae bacterium]|nr:DUF1289 domain-containing protein [Porticoccaceae bacterium]